jgi:hypothetical protein
MKRRHVKTTQRQTSTIRREAARREISRDAKERWQRAMSVVGAFASGQKDISGEHDREFAEASRS